MLLDDDVRQRRRLCLVLLTMIYACNAMDRVAISVLAEPIRNELSLSDTQMGMLTGLIFGIFYSCFGIPLAWLADRFGRVRIITYCCAFWSFCSALSGWTSSFGQLAATRVGLAIGEAGGLAPSHSLIAAYYPKEKRAKALSILSMGLPVGAMISFIFCGWVGQQYGWRAALVASGIPGFILAIALKVFVPEPVEAAASTQRDTGISFFAALKAFAATPIMWTASLAAGLSAAASYGATSWLPAYLMRVKGMSLGEVAIYYSGMITISMLLGIWLGGFLVDRLGKENPRSFALVPGIITALGAPFIALALLAPHWTLTLACLFIPYVSLAVYLAPTAALIQADAAPQHRSVFSALMLLFVNLIGAGVGPVLIGFVSDLSKPALGQQALSAGLLVMIPLMLLSGAMYYYVSTLIGKKSQGGH